MFILYPSTIPASRATARSAAREQRRDPTLMLHEAVDAVVRFYHTAGKPEKAAEWEQKLAEL
jgi:hypothetical protein